MSPRRDRAALCPVLDAHSSSTLDCGPEPHQRCDLLLRGLREERPSDLRESVRGRLRNATCARNGADRPLRRQRRRTDLPSRSPTTPHRTRTPLARPRHSHLRNGATVTVTGLTTNETSQITVNSSAYGYSTTQLDVGRQRVPFGDRADVLHPTSDEVGYTFLITNFSPSATYSIQLDERRDGDE